MAADPPASGGPSSDLLSLLVARPGVYVGRGVNHEQEAFTGRLAVQPLVGGRAVLLTYTATRDDGVPVHEEATLLGRGPSGALCLWPVMEELPIVLPHPATADATGGAGTDVGAHQVVFASGPRSAVDAFREEITVTVRADGALVYAHAWGLPGGDFGDRSRCELWPSTP